MQDYIDDLQKGLDSAKEEEAGLRHAYNASMGYGCDVGMPCYMGASCRRFSCQAKARAAAPQ